MKKDTSVLGCLGIVFLFVVVIPAAIIMNGWILSIMWGWFIVPLFHLPELTIPYAIGISSVAGLFMNKSTQNKIDEGIFSEKLIKALSVTFLVPLMVLGFGWIVLQFIH